MPTEPSPADDLATLHEAFEENLDTFGMQYGYLLPVSERIIPLPMGTGEKQAKDALLMYNATMRLRGKGTAATLVERIVTRWEPPEAPKPTKAAQARAAKAVAAPEPVVDLMAALEASVNKVKEERRQREEQLTIENNPLGSVSLIQPAE